MSLIGDALRLLAECSPHVSEELRGRMELVLEDACQNGGTAACWNRTGDQLVITFPKGDPLDYDQKDDDDYF